MTSDIVIGRSIDDFIEFIGESAPGNWVASSRSTDTPFKFKAGSLALGGLTIISTYQTPVSYQNAISDQAILSFSTQGTFEYRTSRGSFLEKSGCAASLTAAHDANHGETMGEEANAAIALFLDPNRLQHISRIMVGRMETEAPLVSLDQSRSLKLQYGTTNFDSYMRHLLAMKNVSTAAYKTEGDLLGFEDLFYRWSVMVLAPELFIDDTRTYSELGSNKIDRLCEYMRANLTKPLTLTDLEALSELSGRTLQLQFLKRFGYSPIAWLRNQRLHAARDRLLQNPYISVTQMAMEFCFASPSRFAAAYKTKFGLLPSQNRKNHR